MTEKPKEAPTIAASEDSGVLLSEIDPGQDNYEAPALAEDLQKIDHLRYAPA